MHYENFSSESENFFGNSTREVFKILQHLPYFPDHEYQLNGYPVCAFVVHINKIWFSHYKAIDMLQGDRYAIVARVHTGMYE